MKIPVNGPQDIGVIIRATRKAQGLRQDAAAGSIGVSENFLSKVERGNPSVSWAKLFEVVDGLGIRISLDTPVDIDPAPPAGGNAKR